MSREIKFRVWGKNSKEFLCDAKGDNSFTLKEIRNIHDIDAWEFTQFTGLKDKNGDEIWEGDILLYSDGSMYGEVVFEEGAFQVKSGKSYDDVTSFWIVAGNCYENPELLKEINE